MLFDFSNEKSGPKEIAWKGRISHSRWIYSLFDVNIRDFSPIFGSKSNLLC